MIVFWVSEKLGITFGNWITPVKSSDVARLDGYTKISNGWSVVIVLTCNIESVVHNRGTVTPGQLPAYTDHDVHSRLLSNAGPIPSAPSIALAICCVVMMIGTHASRMMF